MDERARRRMLATAGLAEPIPGVDQRRAWCWIDDRTPPEGEADGGFATFQQWVSKAASWIGWTGAHCFDRKDRPCRNGGDMMRARDEDAFPVRWYWPDRFPEPTPLSPRQVLLRRTAAAAGPAGVTRTELRATPGLGNLGEREAAAVLADVADRAGDRWTVTAEGAEAVAFDVMRHRLASCVRP